MDVIIEWGLIEGIVWKEKRDGRQKIENHREQKHKYGNETKRSGILKWWNSEGPGPIVCMDPMRRSECLNAFESHMKLKTNGFHSLFRTKLLTFE